MRILDALEKRRTHYDINKDLPVAEEKVRELVERATELVPDAFNMKSSRVLVVTGVEQDLLWDIIYNVFE